MTPFGKVIKGVTEVKKTDPFWVQVDASGLSSCQETLETDKRSYRDLYKNVQVKKFISLLYLSDILNFWFILKINLPFTRIPSNRY